MAKTKNKKKTNTMPAVTTKGNKTVTFKINKNKKLISGSNINPAYYQKNMQVLKQRYPELARRLELTTLSRFKSVSTAQGKPLNLIDQNGGYNYYKPLDPLLDVKEQLEALGLKNNRLAVFFGFGLGYELVHYLKNMADKQKTNFILVIEKELEIFKAAIQVNDLSTMLGNPKITFMVGLPEEKLYVELRNYLTKESRFIYLKAMKPVYHSSALRLNKDYYMKALKQLSESGAHQVLHYGNDPHDSIIGVENMMENIDEIIFNPGINLLFDKFKGKPGIVVATGPSLNKNKHLLKGLEDKALIVSADASLKILIEMGVKPHLITSLERIPATVKLLEGFSKEQVDQVYFAGCPVVPKEAYEVYPGPRVIVYRNFDHFKWLGIERGTLDIKLSSGNMAFKLCEALGCDPIILIGQDLAFSRDGLTHASGTTYGEMQGQKNNPNTIEVPGNDGKPILTKNIWYSFLKGYELDLSQYKGTCINSTEGGAFIQGTEVMPFQEAIVNYIQREIYPLKTINETLQNFSSADAESDYNQVSNLIESTRTDMQGIIEECNEGRNLYNVHKASLIRGLSGALNEKELHEIASAAYEIILQPKNRITKEFGLTYQLYFMHVVQSFSIKFEMEMIAIPDKHSTLEKALAEIALRHGEWYAAVGKIAKIMLDLLDKAETKIAAKGSTANGALRRVCG